MRLKFQADWKAIDWSKSDGLIAEELGCSRTPVFRARREFAPDTVKPPPDFSNVDWSKGNQQIADELGTTYGNVAAQRSLQGHAWEGKRACHKTRGRKRRPKGAPRDPLLSYAHVPTVAFVLTRLMRAFKREDISILCHSDDHVITEATWLVDELLGTSATQHLKDKLRFNPKTLTFKAVL